MALDSNATKISSLIDPEVLADYVESKLIDAIKFSPLAKINYELQGRAGSTLTIPVYNYIGDAEDVAEGEDIPLGELTASTTEVTVKKAGRGVQLTDESVLYAYGDTIEEAANQIVTAIKNKIEKDHISDLDSTSRIYNTGSPKLTSEAIIKALALFGEDYEEGEAVVFVNAEQKADLITEDGWISATEIGAEMKVRGAVGMIGGAQVVVSNRITTGTNYIIKRGGLGLVLKRDLMMESDRDIINKSTVITADKHYATYIADESKIIKIMAGMPT